MEENEIIKKESQGIEPIVTKPDNYLVWAILETVMLCMPLGIAAILYSNKVDTMWLMGDHQGAVDAAKMTKKLLIIGACVAAAFWILYIVFIVVYFVFLVGLMAATEMM